jgi:hypothetical protein
MARAERPSASTFECLIAVVYPLRGDGNVCGWSHSLSSDLGGIRREGVRKARAL